VRIPFGAPTVSDATKLGLANSLPPGLTGVRLYELLPQLLASDDFVNLNAWDVTDSGGKISVAGGVVSIDGDGTYYHNGMALSSPVSFADGKFEIKVRWDTAVKGEDGFGIHNSGSLSVNFAPLGMFTHVTGFAAIRVAGTSYFYGQPLDADTWYTFRFYVRINSVYGSNEIGVTIQGGSFTEETLIGNGSLYSNFLSDMYFNVTRKGSSSGDPIQLKEWRWYSGFSTAGETLTYVADAGSGQTFTGLDFTNFEPDGDWDPINATFAYSFDDGTPSYSAEKTLATLNDVGAVAGSHRYVRMRVTVNSDGATQQYSGEINADDAVTSAGSVTDPDTVIKSAGGNWDDTAIATTTVKKNTLYGLSQTGNYGPVSYAGGGLTNDAGQLRNRYAPGENINLDGLTITVDVTATFNVKVYLYNTSQQLQATLLNANKAFTAGVPLSLETMGIAPITVATCADYYILIAFNGFNTPIKINFSIVDSPAAASVLADDTVEQVTGGVALSDVMPPRGTSDKLYSAADEAFRNTNPGAAWTVREADGGPASYKILGVTYTPSFDVTALTDAAYAAGYAAAEALFAAWEAARNTLVGAAKVLKDWAYKQFGTDYTGELATATPTAPTWGAAPTRGDGTVTINVVAANPTDVVYARHAAWSATPAWSAESETFKRTGSGEIVLTGLPNDALRMATVYVKSGGLMSAWLAPRFAIPTADTQSAIEQIMDAVAAQINALGLTSKDSAGAAVAISASVEIPPKFAAVNTPCVKVFPDTEEAEPARSRNLVSYRVNVAFCQRSKSAVQRDEQMRVREALRDQFLGKHLVSMRAAVCIGEAESGILDMEALEERFQWISNITFVFETLRARA